MNSALGGSEATSLVPKKRRWYLVEVHRLPLALPGGERTSHIAPRPPLPAPGQSAIRRDMGASLKPWHWLTIAFHVLIVLPLLWFGLAYGGLPRLWSHHEHKRGSRRDEVISYTSQDIPADPVNLHVAGSRDALACAFRRAGWFIADHVAVWSGLKIGGSVVLDQAYPQAPVSNLYVHDRVQDLAFEKADGRSADTRHHVRFWQVGPDDWLAAATFDRGVGLSLFTLQITHHIGADVDGERDAVGRILVAAGARPGDREPSRMPPGLWHRNGGGDRYRSDGMIARYTLAARGCR